MIVFVIIYRRVIHAVSLEQVGRKLVYLHLSESEGRVIELPATVEHN